MSMKKIKFTGLLTRKKAVRYLIYVLFVCVFAVFVIKLNQVEKTELVVRTGQTFEKAKVIKILQDNLEENGTRVGEQKVRVRMLTGVRKGEGLDITSSSGYLFGAACKPGMKVIGNCHAKRCRRFYSCQCLYTGQRRGYLYFCPDIPFGSLPDRWETGDKGMPGTCFYILLCDFCISAVSVPEIFPLLDCYICMFYHYAGYDVSDRRAYTENLCCNTWNSCWCYSCRGFCLVFQQGIRNFRI